MAKAMRRHDFNVRKVINSKRMKNNMKRKRRTIPTLCAAAFCAVVLAAPSAKANSITGSIGFGASGVTVNSANLQTATDFSVTGPYTDVELGSYAAVPTFTPVTTFNGFTFNPPVASVTPLWSFLVGSVTYSFDATSVTSSFNSSLDEWDIGGQGIAMITGYSATTGTWNINLSQSGESFVFDSSEAALPQSVPDGGSSAVLLGSAFLGLAAIGRKCRC
jgi:hypothetical protein